MSAFAYRPDYSFGLALDAIALTDTKKLLITEIGTAFPGHQYFKVERYPFITTWRGGNTKYH